jgi:dolichol kinase
MRGLLLATILLYIAACCLPALEFRNSDKPNDIMFGLRALAVGWSGIFAGVVAWYANPFWLLGLILSLLRKPIPAAIAGLIAVAISLTVFTLIGRELPGDEGNVTKTAVIRFLPGCYVWIASLVALPVSALFQKAK